MPNIIEQQDLLKGLPDARLAMLMQNPVGDIPPFLVAAEAQRRQAIRQQFAGQAPKESVVESLTKQLANVPQNIQAPAQMPPMVPPTPPMAGVAALEQQQMMEQAAMNAQPQQMRHGGMVRRYQFGGFVAPVVPPTSNRVREVADQFGVTVEEAARMIANNPDIGGGKPEEAFGTGFDVKEFNSEPDATAMDSDSLRKGAGYAFDFLNDPLGWQSMLYQDYVMKPSEFFGIDPKSIEENRTKAADEKRAQDKKTGDIYRQYGESRVSAPSVDQVNEQRRLRDQYRQFADSQQEQQPGETDHEFRARIEALYAANEPSDWEKSQRWFAMAEQFLDPSKTTMQSVAGAGRAFADQSAAMSAAQRQAEKERERALLEYDMAQYRSRQDAEREAARAERDRTSMSAEKYADVLSRRLDAIDRIIESKMKSMEDAITMPDEEKARVNEEIANLNRNREQVAGLLASLGEASYGPVPYETYNLGKGFRP